MLGLILLHRYGTLSLDGEAGQIYLLRRVILMTSPGLSSLVTGRFYCQEALMLHSRYCDSYAKSILFNYLLNIFALASCDSFMILKLC